VDPEYKRMMLWVLAALVTALIVGFAIVEFTVRHFAE
jgi:hypothetical protein